MNNLHTEIRQHSRQLVRELDMLKGIYQSSGYTYSQCHALFEIHQHKSLTTNELSNILLLDKSTTSRLLKGLTEKGLVSVTVNPNDQRQKSFRLTTAGEEAVTCNNETADEQVIMALQLLQGEEIQQALNGLKYYAKALKQSRLQKAFTFRKIQVEDNEQVARIIRNVMTEFGAVGKGYSINDPEVDHMYENYSTPKTTFFVIEQSGIIYGCGGIGPLVGGADDICELKKMYSLPSLRGMGWGKRLVKEALAAAKAIGYKQCYLETVERMWQANALYQKMGFKRLDQPLGDTGHSACEVQYLKTL